MLTVVMIVVMLYIIMIDVVMLNVVMLIVVMLIVVMLNVQAPKRLIYELIKKIFWKKILFYEKNKMISPGPML